MNNTSVLSSSPSMFPPTHTKQAQVQTQHVNLLMHNNDYICIYDYKTVNLKFL